MAMATRISSRMPRPETLPPGMNWRKRSWLRRSSSSRFGGLGPPPKPPPPGPDGRSEEHTSELQSLMRTSYAVFCLKKKTSKPMDAKEYFITQDKTYKID